MSTKERRDEIADLCVRAMFRTFDLESLQLLIEQGESREQTLDVIEMNEALRRELARRKERLHGMG